VKPRDEAKAAGFHALAGPFNRTTEAKQLAAVIRDLTRGGIAHRLIEENGGVTVWRKGWVALPILEPEARR